MVKLFKYLIFTLLAAVVFIAAVGLFLPTTYEVSRSVVVKAPPEAIHPYVNDLSQWGSWEPWTEDDPTVKVTPGDRSVGVGANQSWTSKQGDGELEFTSSDPKVGVEYDVVFDGKYRSRAAISYEAGGEGTTVTWSLSGGEDAPKVIGGYFALMMDGMLGPMYERGLGKLKSVVEGR